MRFPLSLIFRGRRQWRELVQDCCWRLKAERDFPAAHRLLVKAVGEELQEDSQRSWLNLVKHLTVLKVDHYHKYPYTGFSDPYFNDSEEEEAARRKNVLPLLPQPRQARPRTCGRGRCMFRTRQVSLESRAVPAFAESTRKSKSRQR